MVTPFIADVELNNSISAEINTAPAADTAVYADLTKAFSNIANAINEVIYSNSYLADGGFSSSAVVGAAPSVTISGDFIDGDDACEYFDDLQYEIGAARCTDIKITRNGKELTCGCTITSVAIAGGDSTAPNKITVVIAFNGKPTVTNVT